MRQSSGSFFYMFPMSEIYAIAESPPITFVGPKARVDELVPYRLAYDIRYAARARGVKTGSLFFFRRMR